MIILYKVIKVDLIGKPIEKETFEQILKGVEGVRQVAMRKKSIAGRGNCQSH